MANIFDNLGEWFGGAGTSTDYTKQALLLNALNANEAQKEIDKVDTKTDDVRTLSNKAREAAGQAAGDKAGIAKKQAKAASAMQGGSRLMNAINAASAASNAATEGYDEAQSRAMNLEASRQQSDVANRLSKANSKANARMNAVNNQTQMLTGIDEAKNAAKQKDWDRATTMGTELGKNIVEMYKASKMGTATGTGTGSDADTKDFFKRGNKMNVKDRYKAKQEAKEEAYYKGQEAPKTTFVDTGNGITEVQTNSDKNEPINEPQKKQTTLQNYKPVEQAKPEVPQPEAPAEEAPQPEVPAEEVPQPEVPQAAAEVQADVQPKEEAPDVKVDVPEVDEEMMSESGINPQNSEEQNKKGTENAISEITGGRNKDGTYKPLNKVQYADGIQKFGIFATIASIGLAVLTRGAFPPVDFSMFTGLNESYAKYAEGIDNYNKYIRQAQSESAYEAERAKGSQDDADKAAQLNLTTENQQKERDAKWAEYLKNVDAVNAKDKAKLDHELEVALQDVLTEGQIQVINANAEVQKAIMELMYTQDVNKLADTAKAILKANLSNDDLNRIAKFAKSQEGMTYFENAMKLLGIGIKGAEAGANLVNSVKGTGDGSDAGIKEFFKRMIKF